MDCEYFSTLRRLLTVTAHVIKFGRILLKKTFLHDMDRAPDYKHEAETLWIKASQQRMTRDSPNGNDSLDCLKTKHHCGDVEADSKMQMLQSLRSTLFF